MTTFWSNWELQEETGLEFEYLDVPKDTKNVRGMPAVGADGHAEIKPHNLAGVAGGLKQLDKHPASGPRILITYRPLNSAGGPATKGPPATVQVLATNFVPPTTRPLGPRQWRNEARALEGRTWWNLGSFIPPKQIPLIIDNRGLFGSAIEPCVRDLFRVKVLKPPRKMLPGTGGQRRGADVAWNELADLYAELGRELRDPLYAELAATLTNEITPQCTLTDR